MVAQCKLLPPGTLIYKYFNAVQGARGICKQHKDLRDVFSVVVCLRPPTAGGHLVLESGDYFAMKKGDFAIIPGALVSHGNRYGNWSCDLNFARLKYTHRLLFVMKNKRCLCQCLFAVAIIACLASNSTSMALL